MRECSACGVGKEADEFYSSKGQCKACILRKRAQIIRQRACVQCKEVKAHVLFRKHARVCLKCCGLEEPALEVGGPEGGETDEDTGDELELESGEHRDLHRWLRNAVKEARWRAVLLNAKRFHEDEFECDFDLDHCMRLWEAQDGRCALSGIPMGFSRWPGQERADRLRNASIDRVDSARNYSCDNTQLVCTAVNRMKSTFSSDELVGFARSIAAHADRASASSGTA